jgi:hypothetical protein
MRNIEIMLSDGFIGNKAVLIALSAFATGNLNSKLKQGATPFKINNILPSTVDYINPPQTDEEKAEMVQKQLLSFMEQMPGADKHLKKKNEVST